MKSDPSQISNSATEILEPTPSPEIPSSPTAVEIANQIVCDVISPISRPLDGVKIEVVNAPPTLLLSQTLKNPQGRDVHFQYEIRLDSDKIRLDSSPFAEGPRQLSFPPPPYTEKQILVMQDAFRCASIDHLNERFDPENFKLADYQREAVLASLRDLEEKGRALIVVGTGGGKTQIIFEVLDETFKQVLNPNDARAIFVVNNNVILDEAGDKFSTRFSEYYTSSHLHGGERDLSGQFVFSTPTGLAGEDRLEELCQGKKEVLLVIDECHHTPADVLRSIIDRASELSKDLGFTLKILGATATETRPDLKNVLDFFNQNISYEKSASDLTARGFLVPFRYNARDHWLYSNGTPPDVIHPEDEDAQRRNALLKSAEAFPHVKAALDEVLATKDDKRTLVIAPTVDLAGEFVTFLSQFPEYKNKVVRLTGKDKLADPDTFKTTYENWKRGASKDPNIAVPEIVVAVDLFKEGTDAPGIRNLVIWKDTNSLITFLQTLGRGLRPDEFKAFLDVVDVAGVFRKLHLLQWLGKTSEDSNQERNEREDGEKGEAGYHEQLEPLRQLCELDPEVSRSVNAFLKDVPALLARRYPGMSYSAIPVDALLKLHECIAERCGFESTSDFERFLKEEGTKLLTDQSATAAKALRDKLTPAFMAYRLDEDERLPLIERAPDSLLVHAHLLEMLQVHCEGFTPSNFVPVFPELSKEALDSARVVGGNLANLRRSFFVLSPLEMAQDLVKNVVHKGLLKNDEFIEDHLILTAQAEQDAEIIFTIAEGRRIKSERSNAVPEHYDQLALITGYIHHPRIAGKLSADDFKLPRQEFENLLLSKGLITTLSEDGTVRRDYYSLLDRKLTALISALEEGNSGHISSSLQLAIAALDNVALRETFEESRATKHRFNSFSSTIEILEKYTGNQPSLAPLLEKMYEVRSAMMGEVVIALAGSHGYSLRSYQTPDLASIQLEVVQRKETGEAVLLHTIELSIKEEFNRTHILLEDDALASLQNFANELPESELKSLPNILISHLEKINDRIGLQEGSLENGIKPPVFVVPSDPSRPRFSYVKKSKFHIT